MDGKKTAGWIFGGAAALVPSAVLSGPVADRQTEPPNILLILMDDMGYGDCRAYNPDSMVPMPHLEQMAAQGMLFTDAHSPSTVSAPTRYSVLTGNYPWRGRNPHGIWGFNNPSQILPGQETLGHLLRRAGYRNAFFGKLHLGGEVLHKETGEPLTGWDYDFRDFDFSRPVGQGPIDQGFDYSFMLPNGIQGQPYAYFENDRLVGDPGKLRMWERGRYGRSVIQRAGFGCPDWDSSQAGPKLTEKALAFLERHVAENRRTGVRRPFFLYYCSQACHTPHTPPEELGGTPIEGASGVDTHLDMLYEADVTLGMMMDQLRAAGELDNTLILFTSDNGGLIWHESFEKGHRPNGPLRGAKAEIWEGGHRVPLIARWGDGTPGGSRIPPGTRSDALLGLQDIYATLAELTGQTLAPDQGRDSQSFLAVLTGEENPRTRQTLWVQSNNEDKPGQRDKQMIRDGDWKLIVNAHGDPIELYNLRQDLGEQVNRVNHPEQRSRIRQMRQELQNLLRSKRSVAR